MPTRKIQPKVTPGSRQTPKKPNSDFICPRCGTAYARQSGNFYFDPSPVYNGNNHFTHLCVTCLGEMFNAYTVEFGSEEEAMRRICMHLDWYYSPEIMEATAATSIRTPRVATYASKLSLRLYQNKTFSDTVKEEAEAKQQSDIVRLEHPEDYEVNPASVKKWGEGFTPKEYQLADTLFQTFRDANPKADGVQVTFMHDLVKTKILQQRAFEKNDPDAYTKYTKSYQDTLKSSKLRLSLDDDLGDTSDEACWGKFLQQVENYTPADLYKDKGLFADVDGIKDYFNRFIVRPFKNFFTGSNDQDPEYSVLPGEEEDQ